MSQRTYVAVAASDGHIRNLISLRPRCRRGTRLNKRECYLLSLAAEFVLAGEWPWEDHADPDAEAAFLRRAAEKLKARIPEATP